MFLLELAIQLSIFDRGTKHTYIYLVFKSVIIVVTKECTLVLYELITRDV